MNHSLVEYHRRRIADPGREPAGLPSLALRGGLSSRAKAAHGPQLAPRPLPAEAKPEPVRCPDCGGTSLAASDGLYGAKERGLACPDCGCHFYASRIKTNKGRGLLGSLARRARVPPPASATALVHGKGTGAWLKPRLGEKESGGPSFRFGQ